MKLIAAYLFRGIYYLCPILAVGSLVLFVFGQLRWYWVLGFWVFGYIGMFSGGIAKQLQEEHSNSFRYKKGDPASETRVAYLEIEKTLPDTVVALVHEKIMRLLKDQSKVEASISNDGLSPRCLAFLLLANETRNELCTGEYHYHRGQLTSVGNSLLQTYEIASNRLSELGFQTSKQHETDLRELIDEIGAIG